MAFSFRLRRPAPITSEVIERGVDVALHPERLALQPPHLRKHVEEVAKAVTMAPGSWHNPPGQSRRKGPQPIDVRTIAARAAAQLAPSSSVTPPEIELALHQQGIDWVEPFAPGRPLVPYYGYSRRPRTYDYMVGRNVTTETRPDRIPFQQLKQVVEGYDIALACIRYTINDLRSMELKWGPMEGYEGDTKKDMMRAAELWRRPDGKRFFGDWLAMAMMDQLRYDASSLYRERNGAGKMLALKVIDGTTLAPMLDYFGEMPEPPGPAFQQFIQGVPWDWLTLDDLIYEPMWPVPESPYGVAPIETVLLNANTDVRLQMFFLEFFCYDGQTEVLTREGWRRFDALDGSEEYATRSPDGAFEWQRTTDGKVHRFPYSGDMVRFSNQCVDQLVTPNHRMLVRRLPGRTGAQPSNESHDWHIRRADFFVEHPTAEFQVPVTSEWRGVDPGPEVVLTAEPNGKRARVREVRMPTEAWAELLGLFVAEGCLRRRVGSRASRRNDVVVAQFPEGDLDEVRRILAATGLCWVHSERQGRFTCSSKALYEALEAVGHGAPNKHLPPEVMDWTPALIGHLLHGLMVGDGHVTPSGQMVYTTTSPVLAGQVQELWQKVGVYAGVHRCEPDPRTYAKLVQYKVRTRPEEAFRVPSPTLEHYEGAVSCVSVPNGVIMVRRNGKAMWCGNTAGAVPEVFALAPPDQSDPDSLAEWEEDANNRLRGNQAARHGMMWLPAGTEIKPYKQIEQLDPKIAEYVIRRTVAAFGLVPQNLGVLDDVNRATSETQVDQQFRVGTLPHVRHWEAIINSVTQEDYQLPVSAHFDTGREVEDRLIEAQTHQVWVSIGAESPDEPREKILGLPVNTDNPAPRGFFSPKGVFMPISQLQSLAGSIDPETFSPVGKPAEPQWAQAIAGFGPSAPQTMQLGPQDIHQQSGSEHAGAPVDPEDAQYQSAATETANRSAGYGVAGLERNSRRGQKSLDISRWQRQSRERVRKGKSPRRFLDSAIDARTHDAIWSYLAKSESLEDVDSAFRSGLIEAAKAQAGLRPPQGLPVEAPITLAGGQSGPKDRKRPGPYGHLEPLLTAYWEGPVLAALMASVPALEATNGWLREQAKTPGLPVDSDAAEAMARAYTVQMHMTSEPLHGVLQKVYADSWLPGVRDALGQIQERAPHLLQPGLPISAAALAVDWDTWQPGDPSLPKDLASIGFDPMAADAGRWLKEIDDTTCRNIAQVLHDGVVAGLGNDKIAAQIDEYLHDPARARMISTTETNRAMSRAAYATYKAHGLGEWDLVTAADPCPVCAAVKAGNPHTMQETMLMSPLHPRCRCSVAPAARFHGPVKVPGLSGAAR